MREREGYTYIYSLNETIHRWPLIYRALLPTAHIYTGEIHIARAVALATALHRHEIQQLDSSPAGLAHTLSLSLANSLNLTWHLHLLASSPAFIYIQYIHHSYSDDYSSSSSLVCMGSFEIHIGGHLSLRARIYISRRRPPLYFTFGPMVVSRREAIKPQLRIIPARYIISTLHPQGRAYNIYKCADIRTYIPMMIIIYKNFVVFVNFVCVCVFFNHSLKWKQRKYQTSFAYV